MTASTAGPCLNHQQDPARPFQTGCQIRVTVSRQDDLIFRQVCYKLPGHRAGTVVNSHRVTFVGNIQSQVLPHHAQTNNCKFAFSINPPMLILLVLFYSKQVPYSFTQKSFFGFLNPGIHPATHHRPRFSHNQDLQAEIDLP
jgi:hypothetical protein